MLIVHARDRLEGACLDCGAEYFALQSAVEVARIELLQVRNFLIARHVRETVEKMWEQRHQHHRQPERDRGKNAQARKQSRR